MMESLFRLTELENRISLNMNVLVDGVVPRVLSLAEALRQWLDHRRAVLVRRSRHRLGQIAHRLEVLAGMIVAFLNLDEVIRIIREEDEPKDVLKATFGLTEVQANYVLDTRLRSLRRLEEMELRREHDALEAEKVTIEALLANPVAQWKKVAGQIREVRKTFGPDTPLGRRRTSFAQAPHTADVDLASALIEREPITVVLSQKGWVRALKGHVADLSGLAYKGDDSLKASFFTETTAKILVLATNGKVFTIDAARLPGGRGTGEPIRLMADIDESADIVSVFPYVPGAKTLLAGSDVRGFVVAHDEMLSSTRKGKGILAVDPPAKAVLAVPAAGDHVAVIGDNRKLLVFPLNQVPELARGKGVRLQKYRDGGISDVKVFTMQEGLSWKDPAGRTFTLLAAELREWLADRAETGRLPPRGFPKTNRFG